MIEIVAPKAPRILSCLYLFFEKFVASLIRYGLKFATPYHWDTRALVFPRPQKQNLAWDYPGGGPPIKLMLLLI